MEEKDKDNEGNELVMEINEEGRKEKKQIINQIKANSIGKAFVV
jgi:hypothetical protein